jgi:SAM-dependent methyltransferase
MKIRYQRSYDAWFGFDDFLKDLILRRGLRRICEIGGGANPSLPIDFIRKHNLEYTVLDISEEELAKAPEGYLKLHHDIMDPDFERIGTFDLAFSRMVAEHVANGAIFHRNVRRLLRDGGVAFHYFPTLFTLPYVLNYLIPERLSDALLHRVQGEREKEGNHGKFPALYQWCLGPVPHQLRRLEKVGYSIDEYIGFYGHSYYIKIKPVHALHVKISDFLIKHPIPWITTYAYVVMSKKGTIDT